MRAHISIRGRLCGDLVGPASLILVTISDVLAATIQAPLTFAINWLTTAALCALGRLILKWASISTVQGRLSDHIISAALVLVICFIVVASVIHAPSTNTVHRLGTTLISALLELVGIWASISTVGRSNHNPVQSATLVLVSILVMVASVIRVPTANTVHRLGTTTHCALNIAVSKRTRVAVM